VSTDGQAAPLFIGVSTNGCPLAAFPREDVLRADESVERRLDSLRVTPGC
jgi:hypothetical protein